MKKVIEEPTENEPKLIMGIKGVARYLKVSTTRAHVYMTGKQAILPEPYHSNSGKSHEYRCYTEAQLRPVKYLLNLSGKLEVIKAALKYLAELSDARARIAELEAENDRLTVELEKSKIIGAKVGEEIEKDGFELLAENEEMIEIEDPEEMIRRQEQEKKGDIGEVVETNPPTPALKLNNS